MRRPIASAWTAAAILSMSLLSILRHHSARGFIGSSPSVAAWTSSGRLGRYPAGHGVASSLQKRYKFVHRRRRMSSQDEVAGLTSFDSMSLKELKELAEKHGLPGKQKRTIVNQLKEFYGAAGAEASEWTEGEIHEDGTAHFVVAPDADEESGLPTIPVDEEDDWVSVPVDDNFFLRVANADGDDDDEESEEGIGAGDPEDGDDDEYDEDDDDDPMAARLRAARQGMGAKSSLVIEADPSKYGFDPKGDEKLDLSVFKISGKYDACPGCGITFQGVEPSSPGYLPPEKLDELAAKVAQDKARRQLESGHIDLDSFDPLDVGTIGDGASGKDGEEGEEGGEDQAPICQRCHKLRYSGMMEDSLRPGMSSHELLTPKRFEELLTPLRTKRCVIIYLVDLFDFHGSFLYNLPEIIGDNPVLIAANKVDLLPKDMSHERVKLWLRDECRSRGLRDIEMRDIHLLSCKTGLGVPAILKKARGEATIRGCDIYTIGSANVGKSTFINHLLQDKRMVKKGKASHSNKLTRQGLTVSIVPGTTLDFLKIDLGGPKLFDTPGLILPHQITSHLNPKELKAVIPQKQVEHVTLRVSEGKAVLIGGLAKVELVRGRPFLLTFFISNEVRLHCTSAEKADDFIEKHTGTMLFPPWDMERVKALQPMADTVFTVQGDGWKRAGVDVVLSGLGWVSITGAGSCDIKVTAPKDMLVMLRDPLMPYEAWDSTSKFTGSKTVKKGKKKQGRRV